MIPRIRPSYSVAELRAAWRASSDAVTVFEARLAAHFGMRHALVFPYGRSAIFHCLKALQLTGEVVQPAYNCVVVAHATVLAGCRPVFVDTPPDDPNQDADAMVSRVGADTVAAVPTSIFGVSFDAAALCEAMRRRNPKTFILMDCCQCFDARWRGDLIAAQGDAAVLAFGIGKPMTTLYGGALLTNRDDVAAAVRQQRDATFFARPASARLYRWLYLLLSWSALSSLGARVTDALENADTPLHRYLLRLRSREAIRLPADNCASMLPMEAAIGQVQLQRVADFLRRRREIATVYARELRAVPGLQLLEWPEGSSYAIYAARLADPDRRHQVVAALRRGGIQADTTLGYVVPGLPCYQSHGYDADRFPNATAWARSVINLPNHPTMTRAEVERVVTIVRNAFGCH